MAETAGAVAGRTAPHAEAHGHGPHILSTRFLAAILGALLVLTVVTVAVAYVDLGPANTAIAMLIATIKASLVALFFMHLRWDRPFNALVLVCSLLGLSLFLFMALLDSSQYQHELNVGYAEVKMKALRGETGDAPEAPPADPLAAGREVYSTVCAACHQPTGQGLAGTFPPLAGSDFLLADKNRAIGIVLRGLTGPVTVNGAQFNSVMPPQGGTLNDQQIAAVLTFVLNSWGNQGGQVTPAEVAAARQQGQ